MASRRTPAVRREPAQRSLAFDFRHLGDSGGEPRQSLPAPTEQTGRLRRPPWRCARPSTDVDPDRIVVWGSSFSGGTAVQLATTDPRIAGAASWWDPLLDGRSPGAGHECAASPLVAIRVMLAASAQPGRATDPDPGHGPAGSCAGHGVARRGRGIRRRGGTGLTVAQRDLTRGVRNGRTSPPGPAGSPGSPARSGSAWANATSRSRNRAIERLAEQRSAARSCTGTTSTTSRRASAPVRERIAADQVDWLRRTVLA